VVGAGGLGASIGAGLIRAGHDVLFVDANQRLVDKLNADGVTVVTDDRQHTLPAAATSGPSSTETCDVAIFLVKAYQTDAAAKLASPLVASDTTVATIQNGLGSAEALAQRFSPSQIVHGVTYHGGTVLGLGCVRHVAGHTVLGPIDGIDLSHADRVAHLFRDAGWSVDVVASVGSQIWKKLVMNACNAVAALTGLSNGAMVADDGVRRLLHDIVEEGLGVAHALGHTTFDLDDCLREMDAVLARSGEGKASMLQDFEAGRRTEVDALNGAIVAAAQRVCVDASINRTLLSLVKGWERANGLVERTEVNATTE
jgi:2-dehydropantoate 2-reductase